MSRKAAAAAKIVGKMKKKQAKPVTHLPYFTTEIRAGEATPAPPLGTQLGERGINVAQFVKDFNKATDMHIQGVPLTTEINVNADRTYKMDIRAPPLSWFVLHAAGLRRGASKPEPYTNPAGRITLKHAYEIARIKIRDSNLEGTDMKRMVQKVLVAAWCAGIRVERSIDDVYEYKEFLERRKVETEEELRRIEEEKQAKLLRT